VPQLVDGGIAVVREPSAPERFPTEAAGHGRRGIQPTCPDSMGCATSLWRHGCPHYHIRRRIKPACKTLISY
jgi:hypothetical protein